MNECDHIVGLDKHSYETLIVRKSDPESEYTYIERFKFCPVCGEKLDDNT